MSKIATFYCIKKNEHTLLCTKNIRAINKEI